MWGGGGEKNLIVFKNSGCLVKKLKLHLFVFIVLLWVLSCDKLIKSVIITQKVYIVYIFKIEIEKHVCFI